MNKLRLQTLLVLFLALKLSNGLGIRETCNKKDPSMVAICKSKINNEKRVTMTHPNYPLTCYCGSASRFRRLGELERAECFYACYPGQNTRRKVITRYSYKNDCVCKKGKPMDPYAERQQSRYMMFPMFYY